MAKKSTEDVDKMHVFGTPDEFHFYKDNVTRRLGDKPIAICSDHSGFDAKETFKKVLEDNGYEYIDFGTILNKDCDYRDYIAQAVKSIGERDCDYGFGFCRTGQGVNICANKYKGIRSALIYDTFQCRWQSVTTVQTFAIPSRVDYETLDKYLYLCANHTFDGGRHQIRIQELEK